MTNHDLTHHNSEPDFGSGKKTLSVYILGAVLCVILTLVPFATVMYKLADVNTTYVILVVSAILQFFVQVICFLRLNLKTMQSQTNVLAFVFSIFVLVVIVAGSIWIMWHLNYNMMH